MTNGECRPSAPIIFRNRQAHTARACVGLKSHGIGLASCFSCNNAAIGSFVYSGRVLARFRDELGDSGLIGRRAFTLLELLIVIAIIAMAASRKTQRL